MKCCNLNDKGQTMICKTLYIHRKQNIEQDEPHYKPAMFTTRSNLQERNHVNKRWLWDESHVRKISMSMDRGGKLCFLQLIHQWFFVTQSESIYNFITVWTVSIYSCCLSQYELYHCVNRYNTYARCVLKEHHVDYIVPDNNSKSPQLHSDTSWHISNQYVLLFCNTFTSSSSHQTVGELVLCYYLLVAKQLSLIRFSRKGIFRTALNIKNK